jgi:Na+/pantothenate symporter
MDTLQISLLAFIGLYFLLMIAASIRPGKVQSQENFTIANRQAGPVPIISSLAARSDRVIRIGFLVSAIFLIIMSLSLIWLGMVSEGVLPSNTEASEVLFQLFQQRALPTVLLTFLVVVIMAITMSTMDTFCYLFSSSISKKILSPEITDSPIKYIRVSSNPMNNSIEKYGAGRRSRTSQPGNKKAPSSGGFELVRHHE